MSNRKHVESPVSFAADKHRLRFLFLNIKIPVQNFRNFVTFWKVFLQFCLLTGFWKTEI